MGEPERVLKNRSEVAESQGSAGEESSSGSRSAASRNPKRESLNVASQRAVLAGGPLGIMQACLDLVVPYVRERRQFGQAIGTFQLIQAKVADMYVALNSARAYVYAVARACDAGQATRHDAAGAILLASENAVKVALEAIQALGGNGYINEFPTGRLLRDAKLYEIGAGTNEIRRMLIGRELFHGKS